MKYIIGNWKMNMSLKEITSWTETFTKLFSNINTTHEIIIAPSALYLSLLTELTQNDSRLKLAAQDISINEKGAHTGDIGGFQIKDFCNYCIVGHSERKEDLDLVRRKRDVCLVNKITPIVCFVDPKIASTMYVPGCLLAWEDPTNISKNGIYNPKDPAEIQAGVDEIRDQIPENTTLIYGGSVNRENIEIIANIKGINGVLPGNASTDAIHFADIISKY